MEKLATRETGELPTSYAAHFLVEDSFRGSSVPGGEMVVYTGMGGGDCGYPFAPGTSYLVYAFRSADGRLHASICSETKPAVMAGGVLRELRAVRERTRLDDIFGTIGMAPRGSGYADWIESQSLRGVPVRATNSQGTSFSTQTDDLGAYAFSFLPSGKYRMEVILPPGFAPSPLITVDVSAGGCRVDNFSKPDGRIEGTVVDATGNPVVGFVTIQPADPTEAAAAQRRGGLPGDEVGPDGRFSLPRLPPARYRLVFHPGAGRTVNFRVTFYWPPSSDDPIDLAFGQHIVALQFKLPAEQRQ